MDRITIRMDREVFEKIDRWIETQPTKVSRQQAVRQIIDLHFAQIQAQAPSAGDFVSKA